MEVDFNGHNLSSWEQFSKIYFDIDLNWHTFAI